MHALSLAFQNELAAMRVREQEHQAKVQRLRTLLNEADQSTISHDEVEHFHLKEGLPERMPHKRRYGKPFFVLNWIVLSIEWP